MSRERRILDEAFKRNALHLVEAGRTVASVAKELDISVELILSMAQRARFVPLTMKSFPFLRGVLPGNSLEIA